MHYVLKGRENKNNYSALKYIMIPKNFTKLLTDFLLWNIDIVLQYIHTLYISNIYHINMEMLRANILLGEEINH